MRRIWPLRAGDTILLHAAAGGVGSHRLAVGEAARAQRHRHRVDEAKAEVARAHGCDHVIDYTREDVAKRVRELTGGAGVAVVYDSVGKNTFAGSLDSLKRRGLLVCVGTASGPIPPIDATQLAIKGSVFVTRPALADYIADPAEKDALAGELFGHVAAGRIRIEINQRYALRGRGAGASRPRVAQDDGLVDLRDLARCEPNAAERIRRQGRAMTTVTTPAAASVSARSIKVEPLTCTIGAELCNVNLGAASRDRGAGRGDPRAAAQAQGAVLSRPGHHARRARRVRAPLRRARGPSRRGQRSRASRARAHLQVAGDAERPLRECLAHRRHVAREAAVRLRAPLCRVPAGRRRHDVGQHGRGLRAPARRTSRRRSPDCARVTASRRRSAPRCRSRSASR